MRRPAGYDAYTLRGFDSAYGSIYLDGLLNEAGGGGSNNELIGLASRSTTG